MTDEVDNIVVGDPRGIMKEVRKYLIMIASILVIFVSIDYFATKYYTCPLNISCTNDGSIEIAAHKSKKILCLMFHPERTMKSKSLILNSIKKFFK